MPHSSELIADRYRLDDRIAAGGVGQVWRATDLVLGRPVAVKLLRAEYAGHPVTLARFRAEARHAGSVSHPAIAQVYDYGEEGLPHSPYLVMELVEGQSLAALLAAGPLDPARTMDVVAQVAAGLAAAHEAGLVHRDIKPANLLLDPGGVVKITDFGIAHAAGSAPLTQTGTLVGTPAYLAPERAAGSSATPASDLYSLGVVAYECLTGSRPFTGTALQVAAAQRDRPLPPLPAGIPGPVAALVTELTAKDPAARPGSAASVAARAGQLRDAIATGTIIQPSDGLPPPPVAPTIAEPATLAAVPLPSPPAGRREQWWPRARERRRWQPQAAAWEQWPQAAWQRWQRRRWPRPGRPMVLAMAATAVIAGLAGWLLAGLSGQAAPAHAAAPAAAQHPGTAWVNGQALDGQPAGEAARRLRQLGLVPQVIWVQGSHQAPGTVVSVQPTGLVGRGSTITVTAASQHGHHHHDSGRGNGNGDGQGGG